MKTLLFVDLLGARARWRSGGIEGSRDAFNRFTKLMIHAARPDMTAVIDGAIETDSCALLCETPHVALRIAGRAFNRAFDMEAQRTGFRLWLRGAVVPSEAPSLRTERAAGGSAKQLSIFVYSHELLDAVSVEKSGFKGMRLLVRDSLVTEGLKNDFALSFGHLNMHTLRRLRHSAYSSNGDGLHDYLWPAASDPDVWREKQMTMSRRLRDSNSDPEEFAQAAATQVVFHEVAALLAASLHRARGVGISKRDVTWEDSKEFLQDDE